MNEVFMLLDRSGSMTANWSETLTSINGYVEDLAKQKTEAQVTLALFDDQGGISFDVIRDKVKPADWKPIDGAEVSPRGFTPYYDAIVRIVNLAEASNPKKAIVVIMTDGEENSSKEVTRETAKAALDRCRDVNGWQVVHLGMDFDATRQAADLGTSQGQTINVLRGSYGATMRGFAATSASYLSNDAGDFGGIEFTEEDRLVASGGKKKGK